MDWDSWLRLFVVIAMVAGAWRALKNMGTPIKLNGRRYYRQASGDYRTVWGLRVKDPAVLAALEQAAADRPKAADASPGTGQ